MMKRTPAKKNIEKRRRSRNKSSPSPRSPLEVKNLKQVCHNCSKGLEPNDRALFVEEDVGRIFCSELCISAYFNSDIERLEKEYFKRLSSSDLSSTEREALAHLRWNTLQEPDEVWREKTLTGDFRFTLISEFQPQNKRIWCICICLFLRGEPSFLYLSFPTKNAAMVNYYRRGEQVQWQQTPGPSRVEKVPSLPMDGLASAWTEEEMMQAQMIPEENTMDISPADFELYQSCFEQTLELPDEVWSTHLPGETSLKVFHFIKRYSEENPSYWYVIVAREIEDDEQIEILNAFPTRNLSVLDRYRQGQQEVGYGESQAASRIVH